MRVIAGSLGGRLFESPRTHRTHPMSDRVRGALFNTLGDVKGLSVLDAYAGTGALSFEAISRGAVSAVAIDDDKDAYLCVVDNVEKLGLKDTIMVLRKNVSGWSRNNQHKQFDIVLADPPYDDIRPNVIERLFAHVKPGGLLVLSWPGSEPVRKFPIAEVVTAKKYGDAQLVFYRKVT
jgi:16S rRNA (guanine966-N2)-methyltransferase